MSPRFNVNHAVAFLALVLALAVYGVMTVMKSPPRISWGAAVLSILVVAIFWSAINLSSDDEDDQ